MKKYWKSDWTLIDAERVFHLISSYTCLFFFNVVFYHGIELFSFLFFLDYLEFVFNCHQNNGIELVAFFSNF